MSGGEKELLAIERLEPLGPEEGRFLTLERFLWRNRYTDGTVSRPYPYEFIHRKGYDAVAIALYHEEGGVPHMAYRPGIRVPAWCRRELPLCLPDSKEYRYIPEAIAGSLEPQDRGVEGFLHRVVAEVAEETGFEVVPGDVEPLGAGFFPSHGQSSEKIHLCAVRVAPGSEGIPRGDGSVNEADAPPLRFHPLRDILLACSRGEIEDPKVELLARRLAAKLGYLPELGRYAKAEEREVLEAFWEAQRQCGFLRHDSARGM